LARIGQAFSSVKTLSAVYLTYRAAASYGGTRKSTEGNEDNEGFYAEAKIGSSFPSVKINSARNGSLVLNA
jgi:hypothetical protein